MRLIDRNFETRMVYNWFGEHLLTTFLDRNERWGVYIITGNVVKDETLQRIADQRGGVNSLYESSAVGFAIDLIPSAMGVVEWDALACILIEEMCDPKTYLEDDL